MRGGNKDGEIQFRPKGGKGRKRMNEETWRSPEGRLLMVAGYWHNKGKMPFSEQASVENLIRYVIRDQKKKTAADDLIEYGAFGAPEWMGTEEIVRMFHLVQDQYKRKGGIERYMDHEIYLFSEREIERITERGDTVENVARKLAENIYQEGHQVVYGVHKKEIPDEERGKGHIHVHFAVNAVNYKDRKKRHENVGEVKRRGEVFHQIAMGEKRQEQEGLTKGTVGD